MDITGARRAAGLVAGVVLGVSGCAAAQGGQARSVPTTTSAVIVTSEPEASATEVTSVSEKSAAPTSYSTTSRAPAAATTPVPAGPKIVSFTVVTKPSCPVVGTPDAPFSSPGNGVVIAWKVSGADGAAISVDNPGMYGAYGSDYPAEGQLELAFPCEAGKGETTHTYTVWAKGSDSVSKTITVSARDNS